MSDAPVPGVAYMGLATRVLAFAIDVTIINAVAVLTAAVVSLTLSIFSMPDGLVAALVAAGGALYLLWGVGYFVVCWSTTGQTPGSRVLRIRVTGRDGAGLRPRRALVRYLGLWLAALPLFAGFLLILLDDRRRGLHDRLAGTVVVDMPPRPREARPAQVRAASAASSSTSGRSPTSVPRASTTTGQAASAVTRRDTPPSSTARFGP
jgi:uncharacterized RDD family membrane protein YckC